MNRRLFLAWRLSAVNGSEISAAVGRVADAADGVLRSVPEGSEHVTLLFLGEREICDADLFEALDPVRAIDGFDVRLGGARVFPTSGRPRLVCVEPVRGARALRELAESVRVLLEPRFPDLAEYRLKPPHVTVARFKRGSRGREGRVVSEHLESAGVVGWQAVDRVRSIAIVKSDLSHRGPSYETLAELALAGA